MKTFLYLYLFVFSTALHAQCSVLINSTDATCYNSCDGFIQAVGNGASPITYSWSSGENTAIISNVCAGTYYLTMTDDTACVVIDSILINEPTELNITLNIISNPSASGNCDASVLTLFSGGTPGYTSGEWYDCEADISLGFVTTPGPEYYLCAGEYALIGQDMNGCIDTSDCIIINDPVASIEEELIGFDKQLLAYPNPTKSSIHLKYDGSIEFLVILDINGRELKSFQNVLSPVDVSDLASGKYLIKAFIDESVHYSSFIKQ